LEINISKKRKKNLIKRVDSGGRFRQWQRRKKLLSLDKLWKAI
jgi:hypothetical protein